ncbi:MAG: family 1 glycosylhydrolase, partial [Acidimicrobiales bacterium]|nr:family 1 glycosylhydrolase [Acidimicrobiales bacterium]
LSARLSVYGRRARRDPGRRRARDAIFRSPHESTLDVLGLDFYQPMVGRHARVPGHRTAGGRNPEPSRALWDDPPDPEGFRLWLGVQHALLPHLPLWIVENGLCNRVVHRRAYPRLDGWDRPRYLRENVGAVVAAVDDGVPVTGYWHWSLVDNYEWGSYEPRFGLYGVDRHRGRYGVEWLETDAMGADAAGAYRAVIAGLRSGDRSVLDAP